MRDILRHGYSISIERPARGNCVRGEKARRGNSKNIMITRLANMLAAAAARSIESSLSDMGFAGNAKKKLGKAPSTGDGSPLLILTGSEAYAPSSGNGLRVASASAKSNDSFIRRTEIPERSFASISHGMYVPMPRMRAKCVCQRMLRGD